MYITFIICYAFSLPDKFYIEAEKKLESFTSNDLEDIEELLSQSTRPSFKAFDELFHLYFFGDSNKGVERNYLLAVKYLNRAIHLQSSKAYFSLITILKELTLTNEFLEISSLIDLPEMTLAGLRAHHSGYDLLEIAYYSAVSECMSLQKFNIPEFLKKNINELNNFYKENEQPNCGFDDSVSLGALLQSSIAKLYLDTANVTKHHISLENMLDGFLYGQEREAYYSKLEKMFSSNNQVEGLNYLGEQYLYGDDRNGIQPNYQEAFNYFARASEIGNSVAMGELGKVYLRGLGVEKNVTKAIEYFEKSAELGNVESMRQISVLYSHGKDVEKNDTKAFEYSSKAADLGDVQSIFNLGVYYFNGLGVEKNGSKAIEYFNKSAILGSYAGSYGVAYCFYHGLHVEKNIETAFKLSLEIINTARQDDYMKNGYNSFKLGDYKGAYLNFLFAENLGYLEASKSISYILERNLTGIKCLEAHENCIAMHLLKGAIKKDEYSIIKLGNLFYNGGSSLNPNYTEAFYYYSLSQDNPESQFNIAYMTEHGIGTDQSTSRSISLYKNLIEKSESSLVDSHAKYPAYLSLYFLYIRSFLSSLFSSNSIK